VAWNDLYNRLGASATTFLMENGETIGWAMTVAQLALIVEAVDLDIGSVEDLAFEAARTTLEGTPEPELGADTSVVIGGQELEAEIQGTTITEQAPPPPPPIVPDQPAPPTSTEIGGPQVDAHINEIKSMQAEHEKALAGLEKEGKEAVQAQATKDDTLAQSYFSGHPDQTPEERTRDEQKFEGAKQLNQKDVEATYETKTNDLKATQAVEMSTLQAKQMGPDAPPPPAPPPPPPPDLTRSL
jgi:hypothetical protein